MDNATDTAFISGENGDMWFGPWKDGEEMDTALTLILRHTPFSQENGLEMN